MRETRLEVPVLFKQLHHLALVVENLDESVTWYASVLEFELERRFGFPDAGVEIAHLVSPGGVRVELIQQAGSRPSPDRGQGVFEALMTQGVKHVGLLVDDIDVALRTLMGRGAEVVMDVTTVEPAGVRNFWIRDNSGNLIEVNQWL